MKERPILFNGPMVRSLLDGSKTQTRRAAKLPHQNPLGSWEPFDWGGPNGGRTAQGETVPFQQVIAHTRTGEIISCPYGQPGDRLQVKEAAWMWCERRPNGKTATGRDKWLHVPLREAPINYAADHPARPQVDVVSPETGNKWGWRFKVGRFLPAWASRITLEIIGVRVERLQDISDPDALAEGVSVHQDHHGKPRTSIYSPVQAYHDLWESIDGAGSWDANPWVWVIEFKRMTA